MTSKWDIRWTRIAKEVASWSKDPSVKVGCVLVKDGLLLSQGYNGFPRGFPDDEKDYENAEIKHKYIVHAEANAIYNAARNGLSTKGAIAYLYGLRPCDKCALVLAQAGIIKVVSANAHKNYEKYNLIWETSKKIFDELSIEYLSIEINML